MSSKELISQKKTNEESNVESDIESEVESEVESDLESEVESEIESDAELDLEPEAELDVEPEAELDVEEKSNIKLDEKNKLKNNIELHNLFKYNINNLNLDKEILKLNEDKLNTKKDAQYFLNAVELLNQKLLNESSNKIVDNKKEYNLDYLYPQLDDNYFNFKISKKKEFSENKYNININENIEEEANKLCNSNFDLSPHQKFIKNFLSDYTPYNGILLYHGLGTGKTCSAIGIAEETRIFMKENSIDKKILIVASPNVQLNFKLQLFDETKLKYENNRWVINNCAGQNILDEINSFKSNISKNKVIKLVENIINTSYSFIGYIEFANLINKYSNINNILKDNKEISKKKQKLLIKNKLENFFGNRLIIIDEIHNIRETKDNSNKLVAKGLFNLVKNVTTMKLVLLSATPMYNDYKEIIFLINILNANDNRSMIEFNDVFNPDGSFKKNNKGDDVGKNLLIRKLNGYVSYVKGDNPYTFPYRILPQQFDLNNSIKNPNFIYPIYNITNKNRLGEGNKINLFDIYLSKISDYQEKVYNYIINKLEIKDDSAFNSDSYKYTTLMKPLEALNMVYPNDIIDREDLDTINSLNINPSDLVGKSGLSKIMSYEQDFKLGYRYNYKFKDPTMDNIFRRDNLKKYSSKISSIIDSIENSNGPIIIYSQYIDGGLIPMALALEAYGFKRYGDSRSLFQDPGTEELDIYSYKTKSEALKTNNNFRCAKYIMITGDKILSPNKQEELKSCNDSNNINGENIKVILISSAGSEGLDFKFIRQIHILEPWYNINRIEQIIGRGVRTCSHKDINLSERNVQIFMYGSILSNPNIETVDLLIYRKAEAKAKLIGNISKILKEVSIDCYLNHDLNLFNDDKFSKLINNELQLKLSNNKIIKYKVGDKPYSSLCDYMESCDYKCYPSIDEIDSDQEDNLKTFNDIHLQTFNSKIIKIIKDLFLEKYFYSKFELINLINLKDNFSLLTINNVLHELVNNEIQTVYDKYGTLGRIVNIDDLYIYQPLNLDNQFTSIFNRSTNNIDIVDSITYELGDLEKKPMNKTKQENVFMDGQKILEDFCFHYTKINSNNDLNYFTKSENSKYNLLSYVITFNNNNNNIFDFDPIILKEIIINILLDNLDLQSYMNLFNYIYNTYNEYHANTISEYNEKSDYNCKEIVMYIKKIIDKNVIQIIHNDKTIKAIILPFKSEFEDFTLYIIENINRNINLKKGEKMDYNKFIDKIKSQYIIDESKYADTYAFINSNEKSEFYNFKIIYKIFEKDDYKYSNGRVCQNFHTIKDKYQSFMNKLMDKKLYDELINKKLGKYLCIIAEIYFRYYDIINRDEKKWFLTMNHFIINKLKK
tara:strand:- start:9641 stop:13678 length:4038 start_codon:yes stop_codon:yes gene_type:complete